MANDSQFRADNGPTSFVVGTFDGSLPDAAGSLTLSTETGTSVASITYPDDPGGQVDVTYVAAGSNWRYLDDATGAPSSWTAPNFDDGAWPVGAAEFGFGEGDEATVLTRDPLTFYFRQTFNVQDPSAVTNLVAAIEADDGAVVYLNGVEVARDNMPAGPITHLTPAASSRYGANEGISRDFALASSALVPGQNVIAVELHNRWYNSSDLGLTLQLDATLDEDPGPGDPPGEVVAEGAAWRYLVDVNGAPTGWMGVGFNDGSWASGSAEFGFGDGDESTVLPTDPLTFYFRTTFEIDNPAAVDALVASINADDGAVLYLNGVEVARDNMPSGPIDHRTPSGPSRYGANEGIFRELGLPPSQLVSGTNVLAVEVHNRWFSSSDLSFDLSLRAD